MRIYNILPTYDLNFLIIICYEIIIMIDKDTFNQIAQNSLIK